jgi:hypothetical protein
MEATAQYWRPVWEALERYWRPIRQKREHASPMAAAIPSIASITPRLSAH